MLSTFGSFFLSIFIFALLGRIICRNTLPKQLHMSTALYYILTGISIWYVVFLVSISMQIHTITALWWGFVFILLMCFVLMIRSQYKIPLGEHFLTQILMSLIFCSPFFLFMSTDKPLLFNEFDGTLRHLQILLQHKMIPSPELAKQAGLTFFEHPPALLSTITPSNLITLSYTPALFTLLNLFLLILAAENMVRLSYVPVKWSNLPLVTIGGLLGVTLLNPFFNLGSLIHTNADLFYAVTLLAALSPLFAKEHLPTGMGAVALAFILTLLAALNPMGIIATALILSIYMIRLFLLKPTFTINTFFSLTLLTTLPLLSFMIWQHEVYDAALGGFIQNIHPFGFEKYATYSVYWTPLTLFTTLCVLAVAALFFFDPKTKKNNTTSLKIIIPAYFVFFYILAGILLKQPVLLDHLQFLILLPIWHWAIYAYKQTRFNEITYKHPWSIGISLGLFFVMIQFILKEPTKHQYDDAMMHTFNVGHILATEYLKDKPIIVLDTPRREPYTVQLLKYAMTDKGGFIQAGSPILRDTAEAPHIFLKRLNRLGFGWLWFHGGASNLFNLNLLQNRSYLFKITPEGFLPVKSFKHPSYTTKSLEMRHIKVD